MPGKWGGMRDGKQECFHGPDITDSRMAEHLCFHRVVIVLGEQEDIVGKATGTCYSAGSCFAYCENDPRLSFEDGFCEERQAACHFDFGWPTIIWRTAADHIGATIVDVSTQAEVFQQLVQGVPGSAHEAPALSIFLSAGGFSDDQHFARFSGFGEVWFDDLRTRDAERRAFAAWY